MRTLINATTAIALCIMSVTPAMAQADRYSAFDGPRGAAATANFRVPLGGQSERAKPSYGLSLTYGRGMASPGLDGKTFTRAATLADLRFDNQGLKHAKVASFDLAATEKDQRLNMFGGANSWIYIVGLVALGVGIYLIVDDDDDDEDDDDE